QVLLPVPVIPAGFDSLANFWARYIFYRLFNGFSLPALRQSDSQGFAIRTTRETVPTAAIASVANRLRQSIAVIVGKIAAFDTCRVVVCHSLWLIGIFKARSDYQIAG